MFDRYRNVAGIGPAAPESTVPRGRQIKRKIYFFQIQFAPATSGGTSDTVQGETPDFPWDQVLESFRRIDDLPYSQEPAGRYVDRSDGNQLSMTVDAADDNAIWGKIGTRRLTNLPMMETEGIETPLNMPARSCLFEPSHFILYSDNVLGMEFNFYGPRPSSLPFYLQYLTQNYLNASIIHLLRKDVRDKLTKLGEISICRIAIHRDGVARVREFSSYLGGSFAAMRDGSNAEFLEITLRGNGRKNPISSLGFAMRNMVDWIRYPENRNVVETLEVKGVDQGTGLVDSVDLLEDKLIGKVSVRRDYENQRHVHSPEMYDAIEETRMELDREIQEALTKLPGE